MKKERQRGRVNEMKEFMRYNQEVTEVCSPKSAAEGQM